MSTCEMRKVLATYVSDVRPSFPMQVIQNATLLTRARSKHVSTIIMLFIVLNMVLTMYGKNRVLETRKYSFKNLLTYFLPNTNKSGLIP